MEHDQGSAGGNTHIKAQGDVVALLGQVLGGGAGQGHVEHIPHHQVSHLGGAANGLEEIANGGHQVGDGVRLLDLLIGVGQHLADVGCRLVQCRDRGHRDVPGGDAVDFVAVLVPDDGGHFVAVGVRHRVHSGGRLLLHAGVEVDSRGNRRRQSHRDEEHREEHCELFHGESSFQIFSNLLYLSLAHGQDQIPSLGVARQAGGQHQHFVAGGDSDVAGKLGADLPDFVDTV